MDENCDGQDEPCQLGCPEDINGDSNIDIFDLVIIATRLGTSDQAADINKSGEVDIFDLVLLVNKFGENCP